MRPRGEVELSPLRSLDDFLLCSARFQLPNFKDLEKWGNRVVQNLLYYQTNYFLVGIIMFLLVTLLYPLEMILGALSHIVIYGIYYVVNSNSSIARLKKEHPLMSIVLMLGSACLVVYLLGSLIIFAFGILLPISTIFVHSSLRLRNIKNKLSNIERVVSNKTPMGIFLESLGLCIFIISFFLYLYVLKCRKRQNELWRKRQFREQPSPPLRVPGAC